MEDDWQSLDNAKPIPKLIDQNKWEGEDEEDDIKDSWDAEDDEKKDEEKAAPVAKSKKTLQQKITERELKKMEQEEKRKKEKDGEDLSNLSPEEIRELRRLQEEADLKTALDTLGLGTSSLASIDSFNPTTKEEFSEMSDVLIKKLSALRTREEYVPFLDEFVRNLLAPLSSLNIRKIKASLDNLYLEKQKIEKGDKPKKKSNVKIKASIRVEEDDYSRAGAYEEDDYDDFM